MLPALKIHQVHVFLCVCMFLRVLRCDSQEKEIAWLQVTKHEDDSDTTLSLPCVFLATPFFSQCVCVHAFACLATWLCSAATFGAQLRLYPLTQNTENTSNLFLLSGSLPCLWQALSYPENGRETASANLDNIKGTKNTLFSNDTYCTWTTPLQEQC